MPKMVCFVEDDALRGYALFPFLKPCCNVRCLFLSLQPSDLRYDRMWWVQGSFRWGDEQWILFLILCHVHHLTCIGSWVSSSISTGFLLIWTSIMIGFTDLRFVVVPNTSPVMTPWCTIVVVCCSFPLFSWGLNNVVPLDLASYVPELLAFETFCFDEGAFRGLVFAISGVAIWPPCTESFHRVGTGAWTSVVVGIGYLFIADCILLCVVLHNLHPLSDLHCMLERKICLC